MTFAIYPLHAFFLLGAIVLKFPFKASSGYNNLLKNSCVHPSRRRHSHRPMVQQEIKHKKIFYKKYFVDTTTLNMSFACLFFVVVVAFKYFFSCYVCLKSDEEYFVRTSKMLCQTLLSVRQFIKNLPLWSLELER